MAKSNNIPQIKNEDQYEALVDKGYSKEKAARIANTENAGKKGGKASTYEDRTKDELYEQAKKIGIEGRSKMNKKELISALRNN
ncbi:Rho termination factor, N-terminal domain [Maribacter dokdonensis]|uniref:Rho termination factor, N-terminal domain n=1 Tax=Maribacter dokdonensis TaxID=320912 RepID=A0A1H4NFD6_9FLAO|nr:Rho termination factor N-terminal domain-containing protein [Maribacter dokdonensis]SEB93929.1 Rho termination factor, N-terminal domain [Maribacter dokdonensis]